MEKRLHGFSMNRLALVFAALASLAFAVDVPFTPFANVAKEVLIQPEVAEKRFGSTGYLEFPAMPKKAGMTAVLKLNQRIAQSQYAGWNRGACVVEINGRELGQFTDDARARLLYRGDVMRLNHHKEKTLAYWCSFRGHTAMPSFYAPKQTDELDPRALDRDFGYDLYLIVDDVVSATKPNKIRILDVLPKHVVDLPMYIKEATFGYIPDDKLSLGESKGRKAEVIQKGVQEKGRIPFTPAMVVARDAVIRCEEALAFSKDFEFPAVPQKKGMTIVLKVNQRMLSAPNGGWNRYCGIEINGVSMRNVTQRNFPRLLGRGNVMHTKHPKETEVPYWLISSHCYLLSIFGPAESEEVDNRITDREFGYNFYLVVDDLVNKLVIGADDRVESDKPNRM